MMKKKENLIFVCISLVMLLLCGCGRNEGQKVVIGSTSSDEEVQKRWELSVNQQRDILYQGDGYLGAETEIERGQPGNVEGEENGHKEKLKVYVCGAVNSPGVVELAGGSRVEDALVAAGGYAPDASENSVNLAEWVSDGQMIFFPTVEESFAGDGQENRESGLVNINKADVFELCTLPGIGESRARDIIAYREKNGEFSDCKEIMQVTGIKSGIYEKICDKITVK